MFSAEVYECVPRRVISAYMGHSFAATKALGRAHWPTNSAAVRAEQRKVYEFHSAILAQMKQLYPEFI